MSRLNSVFVKKLINFSLLHQHGSSHCGGMLSFTRMFTNDNSESEFMKNRSEEYLYQDEPLDQKRARLHWQSRKRGISETCLIFSTFSSKHLNSFTQEQVDAYDRLLNEPSNDWDIYYWMVGHKAVPKDYDNDIMKMLKEHCRNENKEERFEQPALNYKPVVEANNPS